MSKFTCVGCRRTIASKSGECPVCKPFRLHMKQCQAICRQCDLAKPGTSGACCTLRKANDSYLIKAKGCADESNPRFGPGIVAGHRKYRGRIGFVAVAYMHIGGTEVWHQTLIRELDDVAGFVAMEPSLAQGDFAKLDCTTGVGLAQAKALAASVDVLVVWGIGTKLGDVLAGLKSPPRVISVSHCDSRSQWTIDMMNAMEPWTDQAIYLCPSGIGTVPERLRDSAVCIPNAPDPARIQSTLTRQQARSHLGLSAEDRCLLVTSRLSAEKRIHLLVEAVRLLPPEYRLFVAGRASTTGDTYAKELASLQGDQFTLLEPVDSPADLLAAADVVLSASEFEGYGLATAEAILAGVPVISTRTGLLEQLSEVVRIRPHDSAAEDWANEITADFADQKSQLARANAARIAIAQSHSVAKFAATWGLMLT